MNHDADKRPETPVRWEEMLPDQLLEAIAACPVCWGAYGLAEPHGPYNALGLDWLKAQALCERAARRYGGVVMPPSVWHVTEQPHFDWLGSNGVKQPLASAIPGDLFLRLVLYQIRAIDARGFSAAILITGHYGGVEQDIKLLCEWYLRASGSPLRLLALADWEAITHGTYRGDHAGVCETSQLLELRPELVDLKRSVENCHTGVWCGVSFADGEQPSRELGSVIVESQLAWLGEQVWRLLEGFDPVPGWQAPDLNATEDIWHCFERVTRKYWWCSLTLDEYVQGERTPFPGWDALGI